ncbi:ATP-binding cassette domain-containing protein [Methylocapsa sp. S129]|uniref:branched-chain amino acid ABC transporter ATP-binding protein/permease n=1 Tax=Methylocapsa sp. S129 TaxID=1641869 RepID=UPI00131EA0E6|nr:branched-chain amino acid ABC transporter ATP-binding protein/permease [Methylocapsa sp. S129]
MSVEPAAPPTLSGLSRSTVGQGLYAMAAVVAVICAATVRTDGYVANILMQAVTYAIAVCGLSVVLGLCGQINLAQAAFFALGAYAVGLGTVDYDIPFFICLAGGMGVAFAAGGLLGLSTLRLGGHYLAMVTISFQQILTVVLINAIQITNGPDGVSGIKRPDLFASSQAYLALAVAALAITGYLVWRLAGTRLGRAMRAVRDNEIAASAAGVDVYRTKVAAFAICALLGGLGGGLFAGGFAYVSPDQFAFSDSIVFLTMALLGGVASPVGSTIGTGLLILIPEWLRFLKSVPGLYLAIYGLAVILIVVFMADGIWGFIARLFRRPAIAPSSPIAPLVLKPADSGAPAALEVRGLAKYFGGLKAVDGVDFTVRRGAVHALIGPNGSGKTTTLNVVSGLYRPTAGRIFVDGVDVTALSAHKRTIAGLGRTFQNIRLFRSMTALENVVIGAERGGNTQVGRGHPTLQERARAALDFVGLGARSDDLVTRFSYGHQRLIEIARALASNPTVLLLDEPAAGLNSSEKKSLHDLLERIAAQGLTILIIDHDMTLVAGVAQHLTVLNFGRRIADGDTLDVLRQPDVIAAYLGAE